MKKSIYGFTLLELLVVLVIAVFAIGLVAPQFANVTKNAKLKGTVREIAALLRQARNESIAKGKEIVFQLDEEEHTYAISNSARLYNWSEDYVLEIYLPGNNYAGNTTDVIRFLPDGSTSGGNVALSDGKNSYVIEVNWLTGRVVIHA